MGDERNVHTFRRYLRNGETRHQDDVGISERLSGQFRFSIQRRLQLGERFEQIPRSQSDCLRHIEVQIPDSGTIAQEESRHPAKTAADLTHNL